MRRWAAAAWPGRKLIEHRRPAQPSPGSKRSRRAPRACLRAAWRCTRAPHLRQTTVALHSRRSAIFEPLAPPQPTNSCSCLHLALRRAHSSRSASSARGSFVMRPCAFPIAAGAACAARASSPVEARRFVPLRRPNSRPCATALLLSRRGPGSAHPRLPVRLADCSTAAAGSARVILEAEAWRSAFGMCSSIDLLMRIESISLLPGASSQRSAQMTPGRLMHKKLLLESRRWSFRDSGTPT